MGLSVLFLIVFVSLLLFGNKGNPEEAGADTEAEEAENESSQDTTEDDTSVDDTTIETEESEQEEKDEEDQSDVDIEEVSSDDDNVAKAFKGDWDPIGTEQTGPHTINYNDGSDDRLEIKEAVVMVTDLDEDDMIEHWIGRGGDQAVIATVYDTSQEHIYRVHLQWVDEEGWQPTQVEELKHLP